METYNSTNPFHFSMGIIAIGVVVLLIGAASLWKTFVKAGKPGWAAIIPIYNIIVLLEIVGKPVWWFLLFFVPCVNYVFIVWTLNLLSKSFGKSEGFTVGLFLLGFIFFPILGFGNATYLGPSAKEANADNRFGSTDYQRPFDSTPQA